MKVQGREIKFLRTVKANFDIAEICPDGKQDNVDKLWEGDTAEVSMNMIKFIILMNKGYEEAKHFEDPAYEIHLLDEESLMYMDIADINTLFQEAVDAYIGIKQTVEVEPSKSKKKTSGTLD